MSVYSYSPIHYVRIVAPPHRVKERATVDETQLGDTIEIPALAIKRVDPVTRLATNELQRFVVGRDGALSLW